MIVKKILDSSLDEALRMATNKISKETRLPYLDVRMLVQKEFKAIREDKISSAMSKSNLLMFLKLMGLFSILGIIFSLITEKSFIAFFFAGFITELFLFFVAFLFLFFRKAAKDLNARAVSNTTNAVFTLQRYLRSSAHIVQVIINTILGTPIFLVVNWLTSFLDLEYFGFTVALFFGIFMGIFKEIMAYKLGKKYYQRIRNSVLVADVPR